MIKLLIRLILNGVAIFIAQKYFSGFILTGGLESLALAAAVLTILNTLVRPILKLVSWPLRMLTFGLFNLVINMAILWLADQLLTQLAVTDLVTLFWVSIIIALANLI